MGPLALGPPTLTFHRSSPVFASSAKKLPSRPPANTRSDAVDRTPLSLKSTILKSHFFAPVLGSSARMAPYPSSSVLKAAAVPLPRPAAAAAAALPGGGADPL